MQSTHSLNGITLLLSHTNGLSTGRQRRVIVIILAKQIQELVGVLGDQLGELGVSGTQLLENGLEHLRLLLDDLAKLLELGIISKEIQVSKIPGGATTTGSNCSGGGGGTRTGVCASSATSTTTSTTTLALLSRKIEQIDISTFRRGRLAARGRGSGRGGLSRCGLGSLCLSGALGDSLYSCR